MAISRVRYAAVMGATSYRLDSELKTRLAAQAAAEGCTETALVTRLLSQGLTSIEHPGVVFRPGPTGWRAAVAGGPDVSEIIESLREADDLSDAAVDATAEAMGLHPRLVRVAIAYASDHPAELEERIRLNAEAAERMRRRSDARDRILAP